MNSLPVYFEQRHVGTIDVDRHGPAFTYDPKWIALRGAFPVSLTMPLRPERIPPETFLPWAANLLPESEQLALKGVFDASPPIPRGHSPLANPEELLRFIGVRSTRRRISSGSSRTCPISRSWSERRGSRCRLQAYKASSPWLSTQAAGSPFR